MSAPDHDNDKLDMKSPSAVGAAKGRCTALRAGAHPTYGTRPPGGKRFSHSPDNTGNNRRAGVADGVLSASAGGRRQPPGDWAETVWSEPNWGGETRLIATRFKGRFYLNVRWWAEKPHGFIPTREGVMIPLEAAEDFAEAAATAVALLRAKAA